MTPETYSSEKKRSTCAVGRKETNLLQCAANTLVCALEGRKTRNLACVAKGTTQGEER